MTQSELYTILRTAPTDQAIEAAALFLQNVELKDALGAVRIVTPQGQPMRHFEANGNRYTIVRPDERLSLERQTKAQQMGALIGLDLDIGGMVRDLQSIAKTINESKGQAQHFDIAAIVHNMLTRLTNANRNYTYSVAACTTFILRDGEDVTRYDDTLAEEKIADWNAAGIHLADFFFLALHFQQGLTSLLEQYAAKLKV